MTALSGTRPWVGQRVPRKEDLPLVTGTAMYVADMKLPGTLEVAFVRSPLAHARVVSIGTGTVISVIAYTPVG